MTTLKCGPDWGWFLAATLPCGHAVELLREWVSPEGSVGRVQCTTCRRIFSGVLLKGWAS